jgi:hypothetical protein
MYKLEYESLKNSPTRANRIPFWLAFAASIFVGLVFALWLNTPLQIRIDGHVNDPGAWEFAAVIAIPGLYCLALTIRHWRWRIGTPAFVAVPIGLLGPAVILLALYAIRIVLH